MKPNLRTFQTFCGHFITSICISICLLLEFFSPEYQTILTCRHPQNICQISSRGIIGLKTEEFPAKNLIRAEVVEGGDVVPGVTLKTSQGDKTIASTSNHEAEEAAFKINTFTADFK